MLMDIGRVRVFALELGLWYLGFGLPVREFELGLGLGHLHQGSSIWVRVRTFALWYGL